MQCFSYIKGEYKCRSLVRLRDEIELSSIDHDYLLRNEETLRDLIMLYTHTLFMNIMIFLKQFEDRLLIFFFDASTCIFDDEDDLLLLFVIVNINEDIAFVCISDAIHYQIYSYLLEPLIISRYKLWKNFTSIYFENIVQEWMILQLGVNFLKVFLYFFKLD